MVTECKHIIPCFSNFWARCILVQCYNYFAISTFTFLVLQAEEHLSHGHLKQAKSHLSCIIPSAFRFCSSLLLLLVGWNVWGVFFPNSEYPYFSTELIYRFLPMQSKTKVRVQVLHSSFFWESRTTLQLLHLGWCSKCFSCFTQFNFRRSLLWCISQVHSCEPANSCETLSGTNFSWP